MPPSLAAGDDGPSNFTTDGNSRFITTLPVRNRTANEEASTKSSAASRPLDLTSPKEQRPSLRKSGSSLSQATQPAGRQSSKKKLGGVLGFLKLKEPSTSALQDFADHERKRATQKAGKSVTAVMSGGSLQKLPDHVPKVNSRWDGLPEAPKASKAKRPGHAERGGPAVMAGGRVSLSSRASTPSQPENKGHLDTRKLNAHCYSQPMPPPSATHPALRACEQQPAKAGPIDLASHSVSSLIGVSAVTLASPASEVPGLLTPDSSSCMSMSPGVSPRTPDFQEGAFALPSRNSKSCGTTEVQKPVISSHHSGS